MTIDKNIKITSFDSFDKARTIWETFEEKGDCYAFQNYNWLKTWFDTVGSHTKLKVCIVLVESSEGEPLMLLPLGVEIRPFISRLIWLGGLITDYNTAILSQDCSKRITQQIFYGIWQKILQTLPSFDIIWFERMPETINKQKNPFLYLACSPNASNAHFSQLTGTFESFYREHRSAKSINTLKRNQRRLKEHGELVFKIANNEQDIANLMETMIQQKSRSYAEMGVPILFEKKGYQDFFYTITKNQMKNHLIHLSALTLDDRILATHWGLVYKKRFYHLFPTYEQCELTKYSLGNVLLWNLLEWCIENNMEIYDFTVGDEPYKFHWSDQELNLVDFYHYQTNLGMLYITPLKIIRILKRKIKHSSLLWKFSKWLRSRLSNFSL